MADGSKNEKRSNNGMNSVQHNANVFHRPVVIDIRSTGVNTNQFRMVFFLLVVFHCLVFVSVELAWSCSCSPPPPPLKALERADVVVAGTIVDRVDYVEFRSVGGRSKDPATYSSSDLIGYQVAVNEVWKGTREDTIVVYSERMVSSCGYRFKEGEKYLIYAYRQDAENLQKHYILSADYQTLIKTTICSRTRRLDSAAADLKVLPEPKRLSKSEQ